jgi:hypothetical protein
MKSYKFMLHMEDMVKKKIIKGKFLFDVLNSIPSMKKNNNNKKK